MSKKTGPGDDNDITKAMIDAYNEIQDQYWKSQQPKVTSEWGNVTGDFIIEVVHDVPDPPTMPKGFTAETMTRIKAHLERKELQEQLDKRVHGINDQGTKQQGKFDKVQIEVQALEMMIPPINPGKNSSSTF